MPSLKQPKVKPPIKKRKREMERRHAAIVRERAAKKAADPTIDLPDCIELMERAAKELQSLPEDQEYTAEMLETLEDARYAAIKVKIEVEMIFNCIEGSKSTY